MASDNDFYGQPNSYYTNLFSDYKKYIKEEHRKYFTLLPINTLNSNYMLHKEQMCNFYNLSKVCILPSIIEGGNRAVHEAMLCGCPIIYYKNVIGGVSDYMNKNNSISYIQKLICQEKLKQLLKIIKNLILIKKKQNNWYQKFIKFLNLKMF